MIKTSEADLDALGQFGAEELRVIGGGLAACGLTTHMTDTRAGLDLTATLRPPGRREVEVWFDEDGYAEVRYWNPPGTSPAQVADTALRALRALRPITGPLPGPDPSAGPAS
jgi:hypothetical protein